MVIIFLLFVFVALLIILPLWVLVVGAYLLFLAICIIIAVIGTIWSLISNHRRRP